MGWPLDDQTDWSRLTRPHYEMPDDIAALLRERRLTVVYRRRPAYQQNDYIGWIIRAKRQKRIYQMLDELESGDRYMKMAWRPGRE